MDCKHLFRGVVRLFAVSVMLTALLALGPDTGVKAAPFDCVHAVSLCYYECAVSRPPGSLEMQACEAQCEMDYWNCVETETDEPPAPFPVINHGLSGCLQGCQQCFNLSDFEHQFTCYDGCSNWCFANYPRY